MSMDRRYKKRIDRYWQKMLKQGMSSLNRLDMESWFDYWHAHPDWEGKGNRCPENRESAAKVGYQILQAAEALSAHRGQEVQCWATLCENTRDNAVYLHSKNPNGTPFPYTFEGCHWGIAEIPGLPGATSPGHEIGKLTYQDEVVYVVRRSSQ